MKRFSLVLLLGMSPALFGAASPFAGGWDLTVTPKSGGASYPDWIGRFHELDPVRVHFAHDRAIWERDVAESIR